MDFAFVLYPRFRLNLNLPPKPELRDMKNPAIDWVSAA
jgi:hypothetical protein